MGGNVFKNVQVSRIQAGDVNLLLELLSDDLNLPLDYLQSATLGSIGLKDDHGDLDIAMNTYVTRSVMEHQYPVFDIDDLTNKLKLKYKYVKLLRHDDMVHALVTNPRTGELHQVDFSFGNLLWLKWFYAGSAGEFGGGGLCQAKISAAQCMTYTASQVGDYLYRSKPVLNRKGMVAEYLKLTPEKLTPVSMEEFESKTLTHAPRLETSNVDVVCQVLFGGPVELPDARAVLEASRRVRTPDEYQYMVGRMERQGFVFE